MAQWAQGHPASCSSSTSSAQELQPENNECPCSARLLLYAPGICSTRSGTFLTDVLNKGKPNRPETLPLKCWRLICPGAVFSFKIPPKATFSDPNWLSVSLQSKHTWSIAHVNIAIDVITSSLKNSIQEVCDKKRGLIWENASYFSTFNFIFKPRRSRLFLKVTFPLKMLQIYVTQACAVCVKHVSTLSLFQAFLQRWEDLGKGVPAVLRHWQFLFAVWDWMELLDSERCDQVAARFDCGFISIFHLLIVIATISWGPTLYLALGVCYVPLSWFCLLVTLWMSDVHNEWVMSS